MRLISRNTDYAVKALCYIARHKNQVISVSELVNNLKIPRPFLRKILQILNKKSLLKSYRGKGGGFILALSPDKIFLVNLIEIFQGMVKLNECFLNKRVCPDVRSCELKGKIEKIEQNVISELNAVTIASLIQGGNGKVS